jgi:excisionase family DNA binding protein
MPKKTARPKGRRGGASSTKRRLQSPSPEVVTADEAAVMLRVSRSTIIRALRQGLLPSFKLARRHLIPRDVLIARAFRLEPGAPDPIPAVPTRITQKEAQPDAPPSSRPRSQV